MYTNITVLMKEKQIRRKCNMQFIPSRLLYLQTNNYRLVRMSHSTLRTTQNVLQLPRIKQYILALFCGRQSVEIPSRPLISMITWHNYGRVPTFLNGFRVIMTAPKCVDLHNGIAKWIACDGSCEIWRTMTLWNKHGFSACAINLRLIRKLYEYTLMKAFE